MNTFAEIEQIDAEAVSALGSTALQHGPGSLAGPRTQQMIDVLPIAAYVCDAHGCISHFNTAACALWGRQPDGGKDFWCGAQQTYRADGRTLAREDGPMAQVLQRGLALDDVEFVMERPDGSKIHVVATVRPLYDEEGTLTGALAVLIDITAHKRAQQRMWEVDLTWRTMFECSPVAQLLLQQGAGIAGVNNRFSELSGYAREELLGRTPTELNLYVQDDLATRLAATLERDGSVEGMEFNLRRKDGAVRLILMSSCPVSMDGMALRLHTLVDITELKAQQAQLKLAAQVFAQGSEGLLVTDAQRRIILVNQAFTSILGYHPADVLGHNPRIFASGRHDRDFYARMWGAVNEHGEWQGEVWNRHKDGTEFPEQLRIAAVRDVKGEICNYIGTFSDMSQERAARERIDWLSHFDALTGLPNRATLARRCDQELLLPQRADRPTAMLLLGIDRFMGVNDTLGHAAGDELLQAIAARLCDALQANDLLARSGGDEFAVLLTELPVDDAPALAAQLLQSIAKPFQIRGTELNISASIGIAKYPADGREFQALFKSAEVAMHQAKERGRGRCCAFMPQMLESALAHATLIACLRSAVALDQLHLHYQPFVDLQSGKVCGMEALLRWSHPALGAVSPARFIPAAEKAGLIMDIGTWVLRRACRDMRRWIDQGIDVPRVSVNISPVQFRSGRLLQDIADTLSEFDIEPSRLCVEVTEGALMENVEHSQSLLGSLKKLGVRLSLDDFGTGYSSLSYLKLFPFDKVKLDQSFVRGLINNPQDAVIAKVVISMAHGLGLHVIAEGVETEAQAEFLRVNLCDEIQGYFFSRPVPGDDLVAILASGRQLPPHLTRVRIRIRTLLLVDDDPLILTWLEDMLKDCGYRIVSARGGAEALQLLGQHAIDVIVSDQRMPGMTGVELLQQARALHPDTVRILLSGHTELQSLVDAINEGAVYRFLTKPWNEAQLKAAIQDAFSQKELAEENRVLNLQVHTANVDLAASNRRLQEVLSLHEVVDAAPG